jgi:hypothetical protein
MVVPNGCPLGLRADPPHNSLPRAEPVKIAAACRLDHLEGMVLIVKLEFAEESSCRQDK